MSAPLDPRLQKLVDTHEIQQLITIYPRAIDRLDMATLKSIYHPGATDDHASYKGTAEGFAEHVIPLLGDVFTATMHHVTHTHIEVFGDCAAAESYFYAWHRLDGDFDKIAAFFGKPYAQACERDGTLANGHDFTCAGRYIDQLTRLDGVWKIADREITVEWNHFHPATSGSPESMIEQIKAPPGRDRNDIAWRAFDKMRRQGGC